MKFSALVFLFLSLPLYAAANWAPVSKLVTDAYRSKLFGGASLAVGNREGVLFEMSQGESNPTKIFDIASLTKVVATTLSVMILEERGEISLQDKVSKYYPEFVGDSKDLVTLEDLMRHRAGIVAGAAVQSGETFEQYLIRISKLPLQYKPRSKTVYSDLSMIFMSGIVEQVSGKKFSEFTEQNIFLPLKMTSSGFQVPEASILRCAPTSSVINCVVHDPIARNLLPASVGNAGVFSTVQDLSRLAMMILNGGELEGVRILSESTVKKMSTPSGPRGLGWDLTSEYATAPRGSVFPAGISFGHTGYTGTTMWLDPRSQTFYVFLSNRVFMGDERTKKLFTAFRSNLSSAIGKIIYSKRH